MTIATLVYLLALAKAYWPVWLGLFTRLGIHIVAWTRLHSQILQELTVDIVAHVVAIFIADLVPRRIRLAVLLAIGASLAVMIWNVSLLLN